MKKILVINPKGGCGKTTLATNLASYYALWEVPVALVDYDPQRSSLDWVQARDRYLGRIEGIDGSHGRLNVDPGFRRVVMDAPARNTLPQIRRLFGAADVVLVPVLASPIDIRAAARFIAELTAEGILAESRVGLVGNRVRENTVMFNNLQVFLKKLKVPLVSNIRDTQNYVKAAEGGYGVFEMPPYLVEKDIEQWRPVINWLESD